MQKSRTDPSQDLYGHTQSPSQMIEPDAPLGQAVHQLVLGHHQSLLVTKGKQVVGVLRLTDAVDELSAMPSWPVRL
jgi:hypothetical protein